MITLCLRQQFTVFSYFGISALSATQLSTMAPQKWPGTPLPEPGRYNQRTDEQEVQEVEGQDSRNNPSLARNDGSLQSLYRLPLHPSTPETIGRGTPRLSRSEQDIFLANTLADAWQLAAESMAHFGEDSTNHNTPTATATTTTTGRQPGRHHVHNSTRTQSDHQKDSGDSPPSQ
jgi:hypothetical protein